MKKDPCHVNKANCKKYKKSNPYVSYDSWDDCLVFTYDKPHNPISYKYAGKLGEDSLATINRIIDLLRSKKCVWYV